MKQEQQWLRDFLVQRKKEKKEQANKAKLLKYSHQKKKLNQRRKSGFKLNPQSGGTETEAFETTEFGDLELLAACTIQHAWRYVKSVVMIHVGGTRCVIIQLQAWITWGVEFIRTIFFSSFSLMLD
jgi:hypothetical protein